MELYAPWWHLLACGQWPVHSAHNPTSCCLRRFQTQANEDQPTFEQPTNTHIDNESSRKLCNIRVSKYQVSPEVRRHAWRDTFALSHCVPKTMPMLLRGRAGPQAAQYHDRHRTKRNSSRTDQDSPPPQFWDNLSHIPLVKRALRELDRRNNTTLPRGQGPEASRPSPGDIRQLEAGIIYQDIKRFSRTGGPDLTDLRGVRCSILLPRSSCCPPDTSISRAQPRSSDLGTVCTQSHRITRPE